MKILHFLDTVNRGGAETLVLDVCRNAPEFGLDISFVHAGGGALEDDFRESGINYFRLQRNLPFDLKLVFALRRIIRENKIDIVHTHQAVETLHALVAAFGTKTKVILTHHGIVPDRKNLLATKFLINRAAHNILVGAASKKVYERDFNFRFPAATSIIYNGVDEKRLHPTGKNLRRELNVSDETLLIGMIGNFYAEPRKDHATLCRALPAVFAEMPSVHCIFAGKVIDGAEAKYEECRQICRENNVSEKVHFLGARNDVPDILDALDVFVCSSFAEGLPIAVNEAMLANVPVILSDIEPLREASNNGEFAEIFPVRNHEILSEKILKLLSNKNLRDVLAIKAHQFAVEKFGIETHLKNLEKLYKKIVNEEID